MKLDVKEIKLNELGRFVQSKDFEQFETKPISPLRAISYINNPHSKPEDVVLLLGFLDNELFAFRSIFAGTVQTNAGPKRFGWCSGNWVHPRFRRKGFSEQLLSAAYTAWNGKLMFTNYAPNSEKLYLKTGLFKSVHQFKGARAYLFVKTSKLASRAKQNLLYKSAFSIIDLIVALLSQLRILFYFPRKKILLDFISIETPDQECYDSINKHHVFGRTKKDFEWIFNYPWISKNKTNTFYNYPFSSFSESFSYKIIKIFKESLFLGFFIFSVRNGHLKTLFFSGTKNYEKEISTFLKQYCIKNKIERITIYNPELAQTFRRSNYPFLKTKKYGQKIYSSFDFELGKNPIFQDGDGDVIFT